MTDCMCVALSAVCSSQMTSDRQTYNLYWIRVFFKSMALLLPVWLDNNYYIHVCLITGTAWASTDTNVN